MPPACLQNQISRKLLSPPGQSRVRQYKSYLWILRRVQAPVQHQAVEDVHGLLQLPAHRRHCGREDILHARRPLARPAGHGADPPDHAAHRRA